MSSKPAARAAIQDNPFARPAEGFFSGGGYGAALAELQRQCLRPGAALLVTSTRGAGKSALLRALAATVDPATTVMRLNAILVHGVAELDAVLARAQASATGARASLQIPDSSHMEGASRTGEPAQAGVSTAACAVLVDDAERLDRPALDHLLGLTRDSAIALVLFGTPRLARRLASQRDTLPGGWIELRLGGLQAAEVTDYLAWRIGNRTDIDPATFSEREIDRLMRKSGGLPGRIDLLATRLLEPGTAWRRWPAYAALVVFIGLALGALLFALPVSSPPQPSVKVTRQQNPFPVAAPGPPTASATLQKPGADEHGAVPAAISGAAAATSAIPVTTGDGAAATIADAVESNVAGTIEASAGRVVAATAERVAEAAPELSVDARDDGTRGKPDAATTVAAPQAPAATAAPAPAPSGASAGGASQPAVNKPGAGSGRPADRSTAAPTGEKALRWVLDQPSGYFTLQIAVVSSAERAAAFINQHPDRSGFVSYPVRHEGGHRYVILNGTYPTRAAAERAAAAQPRLGGTAAPWVRRFSEVQQAARAGASE